MPSDTAFPADDNPAPQAQPGIMVSQESAADESSHHSICQKPSQGAAHISSPSSKSSQADSFKNSRHSGSNNIKTIQPKTRSPPRSAKSSSAGGKSGTQSSTYEYSQESFETFKLKVIQLCKDIGWGEPSVVERMKGGSFNRVIGLAFPSRRPYEYILRIPRNGIYVDYGADIKDQVAVLHYISQFLPVASIGAFDSTRDNALASSYVIQQRIPGKPLEDLQQSFYELPLSEKLQIVTIVAELMIKMESLALDRPGKLAAGSLPPLSHDFLTSSQTIEVVGYHLSKFGKSSDMPPLSKQPFTQLMLEMLEHQKKPHIDDDEPWMVDQFVVLQRIARQMEAVGLVRNTDTDYTIWHWDFAARNIMVSKIASSGSEIKGIAGDDGEGSAKLSSPISDPAGQILSKTCQHNVQVAVEDSPKTGTKHTVNVTVEGKSGNTCNHHVSVIVETFQGKRYEHKLEISDGQLSKAVTGVPELANQQASPANVKYNVGEWVINGVLDWDGALSVPLVLARQPPLWLWCDESNRSSAWSGNYDAPPARELNNDELLIKAHFDQIMQRASSSYIEDTYHRGPWLRRLARFGLYGFSEFGAFERYDTFVEEWNQYYNSLSGAEAMEEEGEGDDGSEEASDASSENGPEGQEDGEIEPLKETVATDDTMEKS